MALVLYLLVAALASASISEFAHGRGDFSFSSPYGSASKVVVFVLDGVGADDLRRGISLPTIHSLVQQGTSYSDAWLGQIEAVPAVSGATISTGSFPSRTGVVGNVWIDQKNGQVRFANDPTQIFVGSLDQVMESRPVMPLASVLKRRRPQSKVASIGGADCAGAAAIGAWTADFILCAARQGNQWVPTSVAGHETPAAVLAGGNRPVSFNRSFASQVQGWALGAQDRWVAERAVRMLRVVRPDITYVTFGEYGVLGQFAPVNLRDSVRNRLLTSVDQDIALIVHEIQREKVARKTVFVITSSRALAPIEFRTTGTNYNADVITAGGVSRYMQSDSATFLGLANLVQAQPVAQAIQDRHLSAVDSVYYKAQSGNSWAYQLQYPNPDLPARFTEATNYLLSTLACAESPDVVISYRPGAATQGPRRSGFVQSMSGLGMQWQYQHIPLIVAGHGVLQGATSSYPARLVDIAPTISVLLGLSPPHADGIPLFDALVSPPSRSDEKQRSRAKYLGTVIQSLQQRASL